MATGAKGGLVEDTVHGRNISASVEVGNIKVDGVSLGLGVKECTAIDGGLTITGSEIGGVLWTNGRDGTIEVEASRNV